MEKLSSLLQILQALEFRQCIKNNKLINLWMFHGVNETTKIISPNLLIWRNFHFTVTPIVLKFLDWPECLSKIFYNAQIKIAHKNVHFVAYQTLDRLVGLLTCAIFLKTFLIFLRHETFLLKVSLTFKIHILSSQC